MQFFQSSLPVKIAQFSPAGLLSPEFAQIWAAVVCSAQKLHKFLGKLAQIPSRNAHFSQEIEQLHA